VVPQTVPAGKNGDGLRQPRSLPGAKIRLRALHPEMVYVVQEAETGERRGLPGPSLLDGGFVFDLPRRHGQRRQRTVWIYSKKTS